MILNYWRPNDMLNDPKFGSKIINSRLLDKLTNIYQHDKTYYLPKTYQEYDEPLSFTLMDDRMMTDYISQYTSNEVNLGHLSSNLSSTFEPSIEMLQLF